MARRHRRRSHKGKIHFSQIFLGLLIITVLVLVAYLLSLGKTSPTTSTVVNRPNPQLPPGVIAAPTPYLILPQGRQEFEIRSGGSDAPIGTKIVADPLDVAQGSPQTVSLDVTFTKPITSVTATVITDNTQKDYPMSLTSGTASTGTWTGTWTLTDTHRTVFTIVFNITYGNLKSTIPFPIR